ncbi:MAG: iron ABC transporter permease [Clostridiales Family XIII bacterium]|jgi:iron complex transport system permease protein|nr:iron ABC transporter permease [Clostridiales Family XIII bacterium]
MARDKRSAGLAAAAAFLLLSVLLALRLGAENLATGELLRGLAGADSVGGRILRHVRLPRALATVLAGAGFSVSGVLIQSVLQNPLAGPGVIGVNAGAGLLTAAAMAFLPGSAPILAGAAFLGALLTVLLVFGLARRAGASKLTVVLSGVAVGSLMTAGVQSLATLYPHILVGMRDFQIGGFSGVSMKALLPAGALILAGLALSLRFAGELEVLGLGDETARALGLAARRWRFFFLVLASALAGASVSFAGLIGFVGLITPHAARLLFPGAGKRVLLSASGLMGAAFLTLCDAAARTAFAPFELPVGILVSFMGAPFFLWLIYRERRRRHD